MFGVLICDCIIMHYVLASSIYMKSLVDVLFKKNKNRKWKTANLSKNGKTSELMRWKNSICYQFSA